MPDETKLYDANLVELCHAMQKKLDVTEDRDVCLFWLGWSQGIRSRMVWAWPDLRYYAPDVTSASGDLNAG